LKSKPGKEKNKPRGELEVRIAFLVKAGSLTDLSKKPHRSSMGHLSHMAHSVGKCEVEEAVMWNYQAGCSSGNSLDSSFRGCPVQMSAGAPAILTTLSLFSVSPCAC
jgi:hypothetical protein